MKRIWDFVSIATLLFEGVFLYGTSIGLPNLLDLLRDNGIFSQYCQQANTTMAAPCLTQNTHLSTIGTLAVMTSNISGVIFGIIYDRYGTFVTRLVCSTSVITGLLMVFFSPEANWLLYPLFHNSTAFTLSQQSL